MSQPEAAQYIALCDAMGYNERKDSLTSPEEHAQSLVAELRRLHAVNAELLAALKLGVIQLEHVRIYVTSRERMSTTGVALYDELLAALMVIVESNLGGHWVWPVTAKAQQDEPVAAEREACARVADLVAREIDDTNGLATYIAKHIRARGEK